MSVLTDRAKAVLDNLKGSSFTNARAFQIAKDFNDNDTDTADDAAEKFLNTVAKIVRSRVLTNNIDKAAEANAAAEEQAGLDAVTDL